MMCTRIFHTPASCQQAAGFVRKESIFAVSAPMGHAHISPGQRPGFGEIFSHKPCKGETGGCDTFVCDALTGLRLYFVPIPRALPWAGMFWPFRPDSERLLLFTNESASLSVRKLTKILICNLAVLLLFASNTLGAQAAASKALHEMDALRLFNEASSHYQEASELPSAQGEKAYALYQQAAATYEKVLRGGFEHPDIFYNVGNAYFKVGDLGRAILNYRRAQRLIGNDADLMENIRSAKSKTVDEEPPRGAPELLRTIFFWHFDTTLGFLAKWAIYGYLALSASILAFVFFRKPPILWLVKGLAIVTIVLSASFVIRALSETQTAVVLQTSAAVRGSRFTVHAGTELIVEEQQTAEGSVWYKVALSKELRGWIQADAVGIVQSSPASDPEAGQEQSGTHADDEVGPVSEPKS